MVEMIRLALPFKNDNQFRKAMREAERGEKRKRRSSVQSVSSAASNASTDADSSSDCEVEKVVVKKKSAKLAAIFMGKKEVKFVFLQSLFNLSL